MKNLSTTGLSLSQAASISNLCYQRATEINNKLAIINNVEKSLEIKGKTYIETAGNPMPENITALILEKCELHAAQAFLMQNILKKENTLKELKKELFVSKLTVPVCKELKNHINKAEVDEAWGWAQLSTTEYNEYLEAEAYSAHIGQFIHKDSILDELRKELPTIKTLEWMTIKEGEKTPMTVKIHHTSEQLLSVHEKLATDHRAYEQRVNYYKAKVKNLVTKKNAQIAKENTLEQSRVETENQLIRDTYSNELAAYYANMNILKETFENERQEKILEVAKLRIDVDPRFQKTIDLFLKKLKAE